MQQLLPLAKGSTTPMKAGISQPLQSIANIANQAHMLTSSGSYNGESKDGEEGGSITPPQKEGPGVAIPATPVVDRPENHTVKSAWDED
jgi:hypothetical protein